MACPLVRLLRCIRQHISTNMHWRMRLAYEPKIRRNLAHIFFSETLKRFQKSPSSLPRFTAVGYFSRSAANSFSPLTMRISSICQPGTTITP